MLHQPSRSRRSMRQFRRIHSIGLYQICSYSQSISQNRSILDRLAEPKKSAAQSASIMPNLMDLPMELHLQIMREVLCEPMRNGRRLRNSYDRYNLVHTINSIRSLSPYWTSLTDQLCDYEINQLRKQAEEVRKKDDSAPYPKTGVLYVLLNMQHEILASLVKDARIALCKECRREGSYERARLALYGEGVECVIHQRRHRG